MLTTPLNGWFGAAGERGTGIAVLRHVAERLTDRPLTVVATGGHELGYMGAYAWVDRCANPPACVAHIGASLAVETAVGGGRQLIDRRIAMTTLGESAARGVTEALDDAGITLRCDSDTWLGEGEAWSLLGVPVLSTTGAGPDFHHPLRYTRAGYVTRRPGHGRRRRASGCGRFLRRRYGLLVGS